MNKFRIEDTSVGELNEIFGTNEEHLALLEKHFNAEEKPISTCNVPSVP